MTGPHDAWALSKSKLTTWTILAFVAGLALLIVGPLVSPPSLSTTLTAIGSAFLSISGALLITEYLLKPTYTADVLRLVGIDREIRQTGLSELRLETQVEWPSKYRRSNSVVALISEPQSFRQLHWPAIIDRAKHGEVSVTLLIPESGQPAAAAAAGYSGQQSSFDEAITSLRVAIETEWRRLLSSGQLSTNAQLTIDPVPTAAPFGVYMIGRVWCILLNALVPDLTSGRMAIVFDAGDGSPLAQWVLDRMTIVDGQRETPLWRSPNWDDHRERLS